MAVTVESRGQLAEFLDVLRRRRWQVLLPAAFVLAFGLAFAVIVPKKYLVKTQVELRPVSVSVSSKDGANAAFQVRSRERVREVVGNLKNQEYLALSPEQRHEWIADLQSSIKVSPLRSGDGETTFVNIEYASVDRQWAVTFLKALRHHWCEDVLARDRNKVREEKSALLEKQLAAERQLNAEEATLTELCRKHKIYRGDQRPRPDGSIAGDPSLDLLSQNVAELDDIKSLLTQKRVEQAVLQARFDEMPAEIEGPTEVLSGAGNDEEIAQLEREIVAKRAELLKYLPNHYRFAQLSRELEELTDRRDRTARILKRTDVIASRQPNPERTPLRKQIEDLELEIQKLEARQRGLEQAISDSERHGAEMQSVWGDLRQLENKIAVLREAHKQAELAFNEKSRQLAMVESPSGNPFVVTEDVIPPLHPTEPNPTMIVAFALVAGLAAGLALALGLEFSKSAFRSVHDVGRLLVVPVLGSVNTIQTERELRAASMRRLLIGLSSILLLASVGFVTWAWAASPELLSSGLRAKIELLREQLR